MKSILILLLLIPFQNNSLEEFGKDVFRSIISNDLNSAMAYKLKESDLKEIKFRKSVSEEEKQGFINDIMSNDDNISNLIRTALNEFKEKKSTEKIKKSDIRFISISDETKDLRNIDVSVGLVYITYLVEKNQKSMSIEVLKINGKYKIIGDIIFL